MMKMNEDRGSPCLIPLVREKGYKFPPMKMMDVVTMVIQLIIISIRFPGRLNLLNILLIKLHSGLSYTFSKSILKAIYPTFPLILPIVLMIS